MHLAGRSWKQAPCISAESVTVEVSELRGGWVPRSSGEEVLAICCPEGLVNSVVFLKVSLGSQVAGDRSPWL